MSDDNVQWVTINGRHIPIGGDSGVSIPKGNLGDKAKGYIESQSYSKLGTLFSEHRSEFGLNKKDDAYVKAYQVIKGAHAGTNEDKQEKEISEHQKESENLTFEKKLEQLNDKNTMVGKVGKSTYVVEKSTVRVPMKTPSGVTKYGTRTVYSVTKFTKGGSTAPTTTYRTNEFDNFLSKSGVSSSGWSFRDTRLTNAEKDKLF